MKRGAYLWGTILGIIVTAIFVLMVVRDISLRYGRLDLEPTTSNASQQTIVPGEMREEEHIVGSSFDVSSFEAEIIRFGYQGKKVSFIDCAQDAVEIAEYLWSEVYDYDLEIKKPFVVCFDENNGVWLVYGSLRPNRFGGVPYALISTEGEVLAIWHTR